MVWVRSMYFAPFSASVVDAPEPRVVGEGRRGLTEGERGEGAERAAA